MPEPGFTNLLIIVALGFAAPFVLGLAPGLRLPAVVLEILAGIVVGPSGLGWVEVDETVEIVALLVLAAGSIADFGAIILLSLFFSGEGGIGATLILIIGLHLAM